MTTETKWGLSGTCTMLVIGAVSALIPKFYPLLNALLQVERLFDYPLLKVFNLLGYYGDAYMAPYFICLFAFAIGFWLVFGFTTGYFLSKLMRHHTKA